MLRMPLVVAVVVAILASTLAGCLSGSPGPGVVTVNGGEPRNALIPTNTVDSYGTRIVDRLFSGLMAFDAAGAPQPEVAQSVDSADNLDYRVVLKSGWTFTDGTPVTAASFVDAWNYGALSTNGQLQRDAFAPIEGYDAVAANPPTAQTMSGLRVVSDLELTIRLKVPAVDFPTRLGSTAFYPLPAAAYRDMAGFGQHPIGNGPYQLAPDIGGASAWQHNTRIDLVTNPGYRGGRVPANKGLRFVFYPSLDAAYDDLKAGRLDVIDTVPRSAWPTYRTDLGDRAITAPSARNETLDTPLRLPHFDGAEGVLRRLALSSAIDRVAICDHVFSGTRSPARDFTAAALPGFDPNLIGSGALDFDPDRARALWAQADQLDPWDGQYAIAYNVDDGHQGWVDAVAQSISATLGIDAVGAPQPTAADLRAQIADRSIGTAFGAGWQGGYPSMLAFLEPVFITGAAFNDVDYSNREFDGALTVAKDADALPDSYPLINAAQQVLLEDMPVIPLWDRVTAAGYSAAVSDVTVAWNGLPDYERIVKS